MVKARIILIFIMILCLAACNSPLTAAKLPPADARHLADYQQQQIRQQPEPSPPPAPFPSAARDDYQQAPLQIELPNTPPAPLPIGSDASVSVSVNQVPVRELLFALARDVGLELDISPDVQGLVTINAHEQSLDDVLARLSAQLPLEFALDNQVLKVSAPKLYLKSYKVPYLNITREARSGMSLAVQVGSTGSLLNDGADAKSNNSSVDITQKSQHDFWQELTTNIRALIGAGKDATSAQKQVISNQSAGLLTVRAHALEHLQVQQYLQALMQTAKRQVLIEATIAEVALSNDYEQGVDWSRILTRGDGISASQNLTSDALRAATQGFNLGFLKSKDAYNLQAGISLLEQFGSVKVISSPKIMALNNQASVLKVVDNRVYFSLDVLTTNEEGVISRTFGSEVKTVPEGFMMVLMPFIDDNGDIILSIRPTITRVVRFIDDPNPALAEAKVRNPVPEIQVRELETVMRLKSGQVAVLGGLMQDSVDLDDRQVPKLGQLPAVGELFKGRARHIKKSELIVFVRPISVFNLAP